MDLERLFIVQITTKLRNAPYTETTHNLGTASYEAGELYSGSAKITGIVTGAFSTTRKIGNPIPAGSGVNINLNDTRDSYGRDKRFRDLLEKSDIIDQDLLIYSFFKNPEAVGSSGDLKLEFTGKVTGYSIAPPSNIISIQAESKGLTRSVLQTVIDPGVSSLSSAPTASIGRELPIVFGSSEVRAIPVKVDFSITSDYALTTTFGTDYVISSIDSYKLKDFDGEYVEIESNATGETKIIDEDSGAGTGAPTSNNISTAGNGLHYAVKLDTSASTNYGVWGGYMYFYDNGGTTVNGYFNFSLIVGNDEGQPSERIASAKVDKSIFSWAGAAAQKQMKFVFDKVRPFDPDKTYFLSWSENVQDGGSSAYHNPVQYPVSDMEYWIEESPNSWGEHYAGGVAANNIRFALWGIEFTDRTSTTASDNYSSVRVETASGLIAGQPGPAIHNMDLIVGITGLEDDGSGTVTGTASKVLDNGTEAAACLLEQSGDQYDITTFDCLNVLDSYYPRAIGGRSSGRQPSAAIIRKLLYQSKCTAFLNTAGSLVIFPYGYVTEASRYVSEADCKIIKWQTLGPESIVTHTDFVYSETLEPLPIEDFVVGNPKNYRELLEQQNSDGGDAASWTEESYNLYGDKRVSESVSVLDWIQDDTSAQYLSEFYLKYYSRPTELVTIELPYFERDYRDIELMDIIELEHIDNPNDSGTSPDGFTKYPVYSGVAHEEIVSSFPWRMAKKYPMRVLSRTVRDNYTLELQLKVLNNPKEIY